ncbi:hypothetical protein [Plantactinospora sp. CA-290183]|uniref:hypothetical protein n=1 Tax=Plantactinospora sp. CA-290183 TaxID=3240006 RepID=UPI003D89FBD2
MTQEHDRPGPAKSEAAAEQVGETVVSVAPRAWHEQCEWEGEWQYAAGYVAGYAAALARSEAVDAS